MPPSFFEPIGEEKLRRYNDLYGCHWGIEWADYSLAYFIYIGTVSSYNFSHPKFLRTAPDALQVFCVHNDAICQGFSSILWRLYKIILRCNL